MHQEHKNTITQNKLKQLKPRFGSLLQPTVWKRCRPILKKEKISKEKIINEKRKQVGKPSKQANNIYSAKISKRIKGALRSGARVVQLSALNITIYYYHSAQRLILILPWRTEG